ncbi:MAG: beta-lactamase family protein [Leptospiraceae bacterium]|nr:beta-lactamase family protein [Leptospiraceae bacterium]
MLRFRPGASLRLFYFLFIFGLPMAALQGRDLTDALDSYVPSLMDDQNIQAVQIHIFRPGREYTRTFGRADVDANTPATDSTAFAVGALRAPLSAYVLLSEMKSEGLAFEKDVALPTGVASADQLLLMTSGLTSTHAGLLPPGSNDASEVRETIFRDSMNIVPGTSPGQQYIYAPQGYEWLARSLLGQEQRLPGLVNQLIFQPAGMNHSFFFDDREGHDLARGYEPRGKTPAPIPYPAVALGAYLDLMTTASDYGSFLKKIIREARTPGSVADFMLHHRYQTAVPGGRTPGFYYHKLCGPDGPGFYRILSQFPGFASGILFTEDGRGAVVLLNARQQITLQQIMDRIVPDLYPECRAFLEKAQPGYFPESVDPNTIAALEGYYRPKQLLTGSGSKFAFLADTRLAMEDGRIRFSGFFETEPSIHFIPIGPDLFIARGRASMDGWMVRVVRDDSGNVLGLQTDLAYYRKIGVLESIGGIVGISVVALVLLAVAVLWYFIRRRGAADAR